MYICALLLLQIVLFGYQAGAMLGDAFLHQLPHAFGTLKLPHFRFSLLVHDCVCI